MRNQVRSRGFTIVELVVVIGIIGLLAAIVIGSIYLNRTHARDAARIADLHQIQLALSLYYSTYGKYPYCLSGCTVPLEGSQYMASVPKDPKTKGDYSYAAVTGGCISYHLGAQLEDKGNRVLRTDSDAVSRPRCSDQSASDFSGVSYNTAGKCAGSAGTPQPTSLGNGENCYDLAP